MRCVVTGGCGFIGTHLVDRLVRDGHQVIVLDDLSTGNLEGLNPLAEPLYCSVTDSHALAAATEGADVVFHTAAWARIERSVADPVGTHAVNAGTVASSSGAQRPMPKRWSMNRPQRR